MLNICGTFLMFQLMIIKFLYLQFFLSILSWVIKNCKVNLFHLKYKKNSFKYFQIKKTISHIVIFFQRNNLNISQSKINRSFVNYIALHASESCPCPHELFLEKLARLTKKKNQWNKTQKPQENDLNKNILTIKLSIVFIWDTAVQPFKLAGIYVLKIDITCVKITINFGLVYVFLSLEIKT